MLGTSMHNYIQSYDKSSQQDFEDIIITTLHRKKLMTWSDCQVFNEKNLYPKHIFKASGFSTV